MTGARPDFSPRMLAFFLRARAAMAVAESGEPWRRTELVRGFKAAMRKTCGVTATEFHFAWMGRLQNPERRARIWAMLGHFPADYGITLTDDGGQLPVSRDAPAAGGGANG